MSPDQVRQALRDGEAVDVRDFARAANMAPATVYRAIKRKEIPVTKVGTRGTIPPHFGRQLLCIPEPETSEAA